MKWREGSRRSDVVARFGGEEFVVLLPDADLDAARTVAEKLRRLVESLDIEDMAGRKVTVSVGVSTLTRARAPTIDAMIHDADEALYGAKSAGRNRTQG